MNENIITTEQVVEATEGVTAVAESVTWRKAGRIAGAATVVLFTAGVLIGKGIEYFTNKKKQKAEDAEEDNQAEAENDSVESEE